MAKKYCDNCGKYNQSSRRNCQFCDAPLSDEIIEVNNYNYENDDYDNDDYSSAIYNNGDFQIESHNFEEAKNEIRSFAMNSYTNVSLEKFEEEGGLFWLGTHKVTGEEMTEYSKKLEACFERLNDVQLKTIDQFKQIYNAFEALDKDYIQGILISIKSAEKAAEDAKKAGVDAQKALNDTDKTVKDLAATQEKLTATTSTLEKTIIALSKFKSKLDKINHLDDIDKMWSDVNDANKIWDNLIEYANSQKNMWDGLIEYAQTQKELNNKLDYLTRTQDELKATVNDLENTTAILNQFKSTFDNIKHLNDIDHMWDDVRKAKESEKFSNRKINIALFSSIISFLLIIVYIIINFQG